VIYGEMKNNKHPLLNVYLDEYKKFCQVELRNGVKRLVLQTPKVKKNWKNLRKYKRYIQKGFVVFDVAIL
jgi:hypothetical protein